MRIRQVIAGATGKRPIDGDEQAATVDAGMTVDEAATDLCRLHIVTARQRRYPPGFLHGADLPHVVIGDPREDFATRHDAGSGNQDRCGGSSGPVDITQAWLGRACPAVFMVDAGHRQRPAKIIDNGCHCPQRLSARVQPGDLQQAAELVVGVAHIDFAALGTTGAAYFQQPVLATDDAMPVRGFPAQAVAQNSDARKREIERHLANAGACNEARGLHGLAILVGLQPGWRTPYRQDRAAVAVIQIGADALHALAGVRVIASAGRLASVGNADAGQESGPQRVFVVIQPGSVVRKTDFDQIGLRTCRVRLRWLRHGAAVLIRKDADRTADGGHAAKPVARRVRCSTGTLWILQAQLPSLRVGHLQQHTLRVALQADEFASGYGNLYQLAGIVEAQLAAIGPGPYIDVALTTVLDAQAAMRRIGCRAQAAVVGIAVEDDAGTVGLDDLQGITDCIQVGFIGQLPAAPEDAGGNPRRTVDTVVVAHDFQSEHARQGGQIFLALILVASNDIDRIAGALVGAGLVAERCQPVATSGRASGTRTAGLRGRRHRYARRTALYFRVAARLAQASNAGSLGWSDAGSNGEHCQQQDERAERCPKELGVSRQMTRRQPQEAQYTGDGQRRQHGKRQCRHGKWQT